MNDDKESDADGLDSLMAEPASAGNVDSADDDKIDLKALIQLSSVAPRAPSDTPHARVASVSPAAHAARALPELYDSTRASAAISAPPPARTQRGFVLPLVLGFALGVPVGAWFFAGRGAPGAGAPEAPLAAAPVTGVDAPPVVATTARTVAHDEPAAAAPADAPQPAPVAAPGVAARAAAPTIAAPAAAPVPAATARPAAAQAARAPTQVASAAHVAPYAPPPSAAGPQPAAAPVVTVQPAAAAPVDAVDPLAEAHATQAAAPPAAPSTVDHMLDEALAASSQRRAAVPPPVDPSVVPLTPSRDEVSSAMAVLLPAIRGCAMGQTGLATAGIVVQNDGRVASVNVTGTPFAGSASGRCMEGVMRRARFPRFKQPSFRVQFPFAIQ